MLGLEFPMFWVPSPYFLWLPCSFTFIHVHTDNLAIITDTDFIKPVSWICTVTGLAHGPWLCSAAQHKIYVMHFIETPDLHRCLALFVSLI